MSVQIYEESVNKVGSGGITIPFLDVVFEESFIGEIVCALEEPGRNEKGI